MENIKEYIVLSRDSYDDLNAQIGELQSDLQIANDKIAALKETIAELEDMQDEESLDEEDWDEDKKVCRRDYGNDFRQPQ